ncbi:MAG: homoserine O-acetyltransferase [Firmicutes bacterium]|nr:homoserine O-acetyltransferase [Bacillota bacterium]
MPSSIGPVKTQYLTLPEPLRLKSGETLPEVTVAYETYGRLDPAGGNAVLVCHALSGDAHAAGYHEGAVKPGWWEAMIGPGKGIDTDRYFVICSNVLGGCRGTIGPSSINPATGRPYGTDFPLVSIADMVEVQRRLLEALGIRQLHAVIGGSMGGMQALQWAVAYPERVRNVVAIATAYRHGPQQIAFHEAGRRAIIGDPDWQGGHYYDGPGPVRGLAVARMIGHITYLSEQGMREKFGREIRGRPTEKFGPAFAVETYLAHQGESFVRRFDANSYLYITKAIDTFDLTEETGSLEAALAAFKGRMLLVAFSSDWLYPPAGMKEIARAVRRNGGEVTYCELDSSYGHDAFLLKDDRLAAVVAGFLGQKNTEGADYPAS